MTPREQREQAEDSAKLVAEQLRHLATHLRQLRPAEATSWRARWERERDEQRRTILGTLKGLGSDLSALGSTVEAATALDLAEALPTLAAADLEFCADAWDRWAARPPEP